MRSWRPRSSTSSHGVIFRSTGPYHWGMTSAYFLPPSNGPQQSVPGQVQGLQPVAQRLEVFLSHATNDQQHVLLIQEQMEALGISVYLAEHDPQPGTVLAQKVRDAIHRCHLVAVLITTTSMNSAYVNQEVGIAHECGKPLISIVEKGIDTRQLGILQGVEYLELDLDHPAETMAKMTAMLQPLVIQQVPVNVSFVSINQNTQPDLVSALALVGLGVILGVIIMAALSSNGGGSA